MSIEISLETPLAEALNTAIQPKLLETGWGTGGSDDAALAEVILLMLVNGKDRESLAAEISGVLGLTPDDETPRHFADWLFNEVNNINAQLSGAPSQGGAGAMDTDMASPVAAELNAPTGPRSMRNGNANMRGGRDKRMLGHVAKAMDRSHDSMLHRVRGNGRINSHTRGPPVGPRGGRFNRNNDQRAANIEAGMAANMGQNWQMGGSQPNQMDLVALLEQQNQMMYQMSQQLMQNGAGFGQRGRGNRGQQNGQRGNHSNRQHQNRTKQEGGNEEGQDVDMSGEKAEPPNPDDTVCKFNLRCTNGECKFAHQSPAAPPGAPVDVNDNCTFGAACKNRKCVGRHPSPAAKLAHQGEQDCKFFPNCQNPRCPFRHPSMPLCRNGANCTTANCKFTHVKTKCKFNPCLNKHCAFAHEDGQQGEFKDKTWTAEGAGHISERKYVDDGTPSELVKAEDDDMKPEAPAQQEEIS